MNYSYSLRERNRPSLNHWRLIARLLVIAGLVCYSLSLYLVGLYTSGDDLYGIWILLIGWMGIVVFQLSWFANPLNLLALLIMSSKPRVSLLLTILAFLLASQTFLFTEIPTGFNQERIYIKELGIGFYLWYVANGIFVVATLIETLRRKKSKN